MWVEDYQWHYDYVRLAWDTGFSFEKCKSPNLDKNKICVVDVDKIVKERDVASVDRYISTVVQYILDDEQAKVLDTNFVKIFRISQLAVEYLLFCKKYLDNTVVLLKKELTKNREESKELKVFVDDLQAHVETLTRQQAFATFKCSSCSKVFASEEYLNSHVKRRHNNQNNESYNSETDKLNMEIKELKERLNNTEKLLKEKEGESPGKSLSQMNTDNSKMIEILEKFENFKSQVDNELRELKVQKSFYEENYGRLFDIVIQNKENIEPKNQIKDIPKTETMTQTDKLLQMENVNHKNVVEIQEPLSNSSIIIKNDKTQASEIVSHQQPNKESLEVKISTTLTGIEGQMQAFWDKLNEIEQNKSNVNLQPASVDNTGGNLEVKEIKPKAKPRSKFSQPTHNTSKNTSDAKKLKMAIEELEQKQKEQLKNHNISVGKERTNLPPHESIPINVEGHTINKRNITEDSPSEEESDSESEPTESDSESEMSIQDKKSLINTSEPNVKQHPINVKSSQHAHNLPKPKDKVLLRPSTMTQKEKSHTSARKSTSGKTVARINKEIEIMLCDRLQELGISESWTRLPEKSFDKALEIVNHQAVLTKKTYPNFNSIKKKINAEIEKQCSKKSNNKTQLETGSSIDRLKTLQNIVKVSYRPKSGRKNMADQKDSITSPKKETIEIKNRALYDTDTESEQNFKQNRKKIIIRANTTESLPGYSSVVEQLKSLPIVKSHTTDDDSMDEVNKDAQKGVLKSFPSVGSLSKKKVLFDLESESSKIEDPPVIQKTGGSTTSIASSILGDKVDTIKDVQNDKEKSNTKNAEKELDDLSDFDLSDL